MWKNWSGASAGPNTKKLEPARTHVKKTLPNRHYSGHHKATEEEGDQGILGERNVDSSIQVQLEEDGGGSIRQSWMETSGL